MVGSNCLVSSYFFEFNLCKSPRNHSDSHSLWILKRFSAFSNCFDVRVRVSNQTARIFHGFALLLNLWWFSTIWDWVRVLPVFKLEIWVEIFGNLESWFCFADFLAWTWNLNGNPLLLLLNWFGFLEFFLFSSQFLFCDRIRIRCFQWWIQCLNCRNGGSVMMIHHWISESYSRSHWFCLHSVLETIRVCEIALCSWNFLSLLQFWSKLNQREKEFSVCDVAPSSLWISDT